MVAAPTFTQVKLTGRTRHRTSLFGKQILQVEELHERMRMGWPGPNGEPAQHRPCGIIGKTEWRDATFDDIYSIEHDLRAKDTVIHLRGDDLFTAANIRRLMAAIEQMHRGGGRGGGGGGQRA